MLKKNYRGKIEMKFLMMIYMLIIANSAFANDSLIADIGTTPAHPDNQEAAKFGLQVASQTLSVVTKVELGEWKGDRIIFVSVAGKACEVTANKNSGEWLASKIKCQD